MGDFEWEEMNHVGRVQAGVWFWSFTWLVNLIMLNMLLAVIMDVYTEVKGSIGEHAETIFSQSIEIMDRARDVYKGRCVTLTSILLALDPTGLDCNNEDALEAGGGTDDDREGQTLRVEDLRRLIPAMGEEQALLVLISAQEWYDQSVRPSESLTDATLKIGRIENVTNKLRESLERLIMMQELSSTLLLGTSKNQRSEHRAHRKVMEHSANNAASVNANPDGSLLRKIEELMWHQTEMFKWVSSQPGPVRKMAEAASSDSALRACNGTVSQAPTPRVPEPC